MSNEERKTKNDKRILAAVVATVLVFAAGALEPASRAQTSCRALGRNLVHRARRPPADAASAGPACTRAVHGQCLSGSASAGDAAGCAARRI